MCSKVYRAGVYREAKPDRTQGDRAAPDLEPLHVSPMSWRSLGGSFAFTRSTTPETGPATPEGEIERRLRLASEQGRAAGEAAGEARAAQGLEPALQALSRLVQELAGTRGRVRREAERGCLELALAIARRVLHRELSTDPEAVLGLVKSAFARLNAREVHRLRVPPATASMLAGYRERLGFPPGLEIAADPNLEAGAAVFETARGELDASTGTQLAEIERGLADRLQRWVE